MLWFRLYCHESPLVSAIPLGPRTETSPHVVPSRSKVTVCFISSSEAERCILSYFGLWHEASCRHSPCWNNTAFSG